MNTAEDLLKFGRSLMGDGAEEIALRSAASRIYYAAFHLCKRYADNYCTLLRDVDKVGGEHAQLFIRLTENSRVVALDDSLSELAETAKKMRSIRVKADYKLDINFLQNEAKRCSSYFDDIRASCDEVDQVSKP